MHWAIPWTSCGEWNGRYRLKKIENHPVEIAVAGEFPGFQCEGCRSAFLNLSLDVEMDGVTYHLIRRFSEKTEMGVMLSRYVQEQGWNLYAAYCDDGVSGFSVFRSFLVSPFLPVFSGIEVYPCGISSLLPNGIKVSLKGVSSLLISPYLLSHIILKCSNAAIIAFSFSGGHFGTRLLFSPIL